MSEMKRPSRVMETVKLTGYALIIPLLLYVLTKGIYPFGAIMIIFTVVGPVFVFPWCFFCWLEDFTEILLRSIVTILFWLASCGIAWYCEVSFYPFGWLPVFLIVSVIGCILSVESGRSITEKILKISRG